MEKTAVQNEKKVYAILMIVFIITTGLFATLFFVQYDKANEEEKMAVIENHYTQVVMTDNICYKTFILKVFDDNGEIYSLLDYENTKYFPPSTLFCTLLGAFITKTDTLRMYYEYEAMEVSTRKTYSDHDFIDLKYNVLDNGQLYFPSYKNEVYQDRNMLTYYLNRNLNIAFQMRLDYKILTQQEYEISKGRI